MDFPLEGKRALIMGLANDRSLAWSIAQRLKSEGAKIALTYATENLEKRARPLAESLGADLIELCDVSREDHLDQLFAKISGTWDCFDILVHSIASAFTEDLEKRFIQTSKQGFLHALDVSVYSLLSATRRAENLIRPGGTVITLTNGGSQRVIPHYNVMGIAKAALESSVRYLACELGAKKITINAISAGPVKTLSAGGIPNFRELTELVEAKSPLREGISGDDVARMASFLCGPGGRHITGATLYVDCGIHIIGA